MTQTLGRAICTESQHFYNFQCLIQNFRVFFSFPVFPSPTSMGEKHKYMAGLLVGPPHPQIQRQNFKSQHFNLNLYELLLEVNGFKSCNAMLEIDFVFAFFKR